MQRVFGNMGRNWGSHGSRALRCAKKTMALTQNSQKLGHSLAFFGVYLRAPFVLSSSRQVFQNIVLTDAATQDVNNVSCVM